MTNEELIDPKVGEPVDLAQPRTTTFVTDSTNLQPSEEAKEVDTDHFTICKELALAIGHHPSNVLTHLDKDGKAPTPFLVTVATADQDGYTTAHCFDYCDPAVIWPIAERFDCFPYKTASGNWTTSLLAPSGATEHGVKSAALAVALTVIQEQGL